METLLKDVRYGCRTLLRNPGFTAIAVLSLGLGIGANTAIFSFIDTILLRELPVRNARELVLFGTGKGRGNHSGPSNGSVEMFSWAEYQDFKANNKVFQDILGVDSSSDRVYATFPNSAPEGLLSTLVSGNFFEVLGVKPVAGRVFDSSADRAPSPLAVLSDAFWARRFGRNTAIVGEAFRIGRREYTVIGVAPRDFFGTRVGEAPDMWLPVTMQPDIPAAAFISLKDPQSHFMNLIGRLRPRFTMMQASASVNVTYPRILAKYQKLTSPVHIEMTAADKGLSNVRRRYRETLIVLMGVVALVLAIACANVANLLTALGAKRQREMAVRLAIGADRARVMRQLLTEGVMLSSAAGLLGILIASGAGKVLVHLISRVSGTLPLGFDLDWRVLGFTVAVSVLTGLLFGMAPALRASRVDVISSLKESRVSAGSPARVQFGQVMVVGQVALSLILLITAVLMVRSFRNLIDIDTGFDRQSVLLFRIDSDASGYKQDERLSSLYARIEEAVARVPGVVSASVSLQAFNEGRWGEGIKVPGVDLARNDANVSLNFVTPGFFNTFHIPILAGRPLDARDNAGSGLVAVIGDTFAKRAFGGANALGKTFLMSPLTDKDQPYTVVGIARDVKTNDVRDKAENLAWLPLAQGPVFASDIAVRVSGGTANLASAVRRTIREIEPNLPIRSTTTLADEIGYSLVSERAIAQLSSFFAVLALVLSAIGLYGTISFAVARRTSEIGIRLALGAERVSVVGMVLKDAMLLVGTGAAIGLPLAFAADHAIQSLLYGLSGFDPASSAVAVLAMVSVAALAAYLPARRAAAVDPMVALRYE